MKKERNFYKLGYMSPTKSLLFFFKLSSVNKFLDSLKVFDLVSIHCCIPMKPPLTLEQHYPLQKFFVILLASLVILPKR